MVRVCLTNTPTTSPSEFLDIALITSNITVIKNVKGANISKQNIMKDAGGPNATMKLVGRKLDQMGYIKLDSGILKSPRMLAEMENQMHMSRSLAEIRTIKATSTVYKKKNYTDSLIFLRHLPKLNWRQRAVIW